VRSSSLHIISVQRVEAVKCLLLLRVVFEWRAEIYFRKVDGGQVLPRAEACFSRKGFETIKNTFGKIQNFEC
jgi:hypothetical protein